MGDNTILEVLGYILSDDTSYIDSASKTLRPEHLGNPFLSDILTTAYTLHRGGQQPNIISVAHAYFEGDDIEVTNRIKHARAYFIHQGALDADAPENAVRQELNTFLGSCLSMSGSGITFEPLMDAVIYRYVSTQIQETITVYSRNIARTPGNRNLTNDLTDRIQSLQGELDRRPWESCRLDLRALKDETLTPPLIIREETGIIYKGSTHLIIGAPGTMKSYLTGAIISAALNDGQFADNTLGFFASTPGLHVAYFDTELGRDAIHRRLATWEAMCGPAIYDQSRIEYFSLVAYPVTERLRTVIEYCYRCNADIVVIDSLRDISCDYNDATESRRLADEIKRIVERRQLAIVLTSHITKGDKSARGAVGSQFHDLAGLQIFLEKQNVGTSDEFIRALSTKGRDGTPELFTFCYDSGSHRLVLHDDLIDRTALSKSQLKAQALFREVMQPGRTYKTKEITAILTDSRRGERRVNPNTAKKYLREARGRTLIYDGSAYRLPDSTDPNLFVAAAEDIDMPEDIC